VTTLHSNYDVGNVRRILGALERHRRRSRQRMSRRISERWHRLRFAAFLVQVLVSAVCQAVVACSSRATTPWLTPCAPGHAGGAPSPTRSYVATQLRPRGALVCRQELRPW